jgi:hypothetical protein
LEMPYFGYFIYLKQGNEFVYPSIPGKKNFISGQ